MSPIDRKLPLSMRRLGVGFGFALLVAVVAGIVLRRDSAEVVTSVAGQIETDTNDYGY